MSIGLGAGSRRVILVVVDQAVSSAINFGVALFVAQAVSASQFGAFAIAFALYLVFLGIGRSCAGSPLTIRFSTASQRRWRAATAASCGCALLVGIASGVLVASVGALAAPLSPAVAQCLIALALALPPLLVQDHWRFAFFARGRPAQSVIIDLVWAAVLSLAFLLLSLRADTQAWLVIAAWGFAAAVAAAVGGALAGTPAHLSQGLAWLREHRDLAPSLVGEFILSSGISQAVALSVGLIAGLGAAGALRGAQVLFGPVNVLLLAAGSLAVPEGARLRKRGERALRIGMVSV